MIEPYMLGYLENEFKGELVYKTPRWVILNEPMPDMSEMYKISDKSIKCPDLKLKPYDYQDYGIRFMIDKLLKNNMVLNADDVGLGKTLCTIGTFKWFIEHKGYKKILIICKKSIKRQWKEEIEKFTDLSKTFNILYTEESAAKRKKAYKEFQNSNQGILITNYHSFLNDTDIIKSLDYDMVIIDEVHSVKARTGKLNNNIASAVRGKPIIFLTGTPVMSKPEDIFGIIQIANPNYFGKWREFSKEHLVYAQTPFGIKLVGAKKLDVLREKVQDILIRRTKYEVSIDLPETNIVKISCAMDAIQYKLLKMISEETLELNNQMNRLKGSDGKIKNQKLYDMLEGRSKGLIAARQAASTDPRMFWYSNSKMMKEKYGAEVPSSYKMSNKFESMIDIIEDIIQSGNKVIIFSKFVTSAKLAERDIIEKLKVPVLMYTGMENQNVRDNNIDLFRDSVDHNILIGSDAMSEGLNLQVAQYVINIDQPDTNAIKEQRIGRARRAGSQFDNVVVYDMITANGMDMKSKDEERLENIEKNKDLSDALVSIDESQRQALIQAMKGG
jgi:SNF2 family DNA or RNA helicase